GPRRCVGCDDDGAPVQPRSYLRGSDVRNPRRTRDAVLPGGRRRVPAHDRADRTAARARARVRGLVSAAMADDAILELYRREVTPELYAEIRELYKRHSIAEDARDLPGLISTLTPDCVYELVQS